MTLGTIAGGIIGESVFYDIGRTGRRCLHINAPAVGFRYYIIRYGQERNPWLNPRTPGRRLKAGELQILLRQSLLKSASGSKVFARRWICVHYIFIEETDLVYYEVIDLIQNIKQTITI